MVVYNDIMAFLALGDTKLIFRFTGEQGEKEGSVGRNNNNINILMITLNYRKTGHKEGNIWPRRPKMESDKYSEYLHPA